MPAWHDTLQMRAVSPSSILRLAHAFETIVTTPQAGHDLLIDAAPSLLVIEACSICGWIADLAESLGIEVRVANTRGEAWTWKKVKRKTDRDDALKLAKLNVLPMARCQAPQ